MKSELIGKDSKRRSKKIMAIGPFLLLLLVFCMAGSYVRLSFFDIAKYLLTQSFIIIVGFSVLSGIGFQAKDSLQKVFFSYAVGYCISILIYFLSLIWGIQHYVIFPACIVGLVSLLNLQRCSRKVSSSAFEEEIPADIVAAVMILICVCSILMFLGMEVTNESALLTGYSNIDQDLAYWVHHSLNATRGYPLMDISSTNTYYYNHYFTNLHIAFLHFITGIDLYSLCFVFNEYVIVFLVIGGIYTLFREFVSEKYTLLGLGILLFCAPAQNKVFLFYIAHIYLGSHGTAEGYAMEMFSFYAFYRFVFSSSAKTRWTMLLPILMLGVTAGLKGPNGLVVLFGIGAGCLYMLFNKEKRSAGFIAGILYLLVFGLVVIFVLRGPELEATLRGNNVHSLSFSFTDTLLHADFMKELYQKLVLLSGPVLGYIGSLICYVFLCAITVNVFLVVALIVGISLINRRRQESSFDLMSCLSYNNVVIILEIMMYLLGFLLFIFISHKQFSQTYFAFAGYPFGLLAALSVLSKETVKEMTRKKWLISIEVLSILIGLKPTIGSFQPYIHDSLLKMQGIIEEKPLTGSSLTREEQEGLLWIRDHLKDDAVLITNKTFAWSHSYLSSFFTERQFYVESLAGNKEKVELVRAYFTGEPGTDEKIKREGIDYAVLYRNVDEYAAPVFGDPVYENGAIIVLQLQEMDGLE
ncbi:MAG: hypothetical protein IJT16_13890 [Lachnospiraceae bacterium]|nr:hypothetical protein [Lachnospiraceae bacterium]